MKTRLETLSSDGRSGWLPSRGETCFRTLDGSDVAAWLERQGYKVASFRDTGSNGLAVTECGWQVSTNGYFFRGEPR